MRQRNEREARARLLWTSVVVTLCVLGLTACMEEPPGAEAGAANVGAGDGAGETAALMPDVMCMDLQEAQDTIQETGVFLSKSTDASGEGRKQIIDRNWVVVEQSPAGGMPIGEGEAMLSVVKDDEPSICNGEATAELAEAAPPTTVAPTTTTGVPTTTAAPSTTTTAPPTTTAAPTTLATTTAAPTTTVAPPPPAPTTTVAVQPFIPASNCDPNYTGACVPIASDVDCAGGSGNGPAYVQGPVTVVGNDIYGLDGNDNDGIGCES
jgi:hypothetical protein